MAQEGLFQKKVIEYLKTLGDDVWYVKYWGGGIYTRAGVPDLLICYKGQFIALELKAPNGRVSKLQEVNINKINNAGGVAMALYPKNFEEFKNMIESIEGVII